MLGAGFISAQLTYNIFVVGRYKLLLEDLLEHTPRDHHDYSQLQGKWQEAAFFFLIPGESVSGWGEGCGKWNLFKFISFNKLCVNLVCDEYCRANQHHA